MKKEELVQYRAIKKEIKMIEMKLDRLRIRKHKFGVDTVMSSSKRFPYTKRPITIFGHGYDASNDYKKSRFIRELKERKKELEQKFDEIQAFIDSIDDSIVRQIVEYKYIDGLSWAAVAMRIGSHNKSTPFMIVERFFDKNEKL